MEADGDHVWQLAGELLDATWGWRRTMPEACHNTRVAGVGHGALMDVDVWEREDLWRFLVR